MNHKKINRIIRKVNKYITKFNKNFNKLNKFKKDHHFNWLIIFFKLKR
jgi:hypothetical protein